MPGRFPVRVSIGWPLVLVALVGAGPARADSSIAYTVSFHGKVSGKQTTTVASDGRISVDLSYRDNGRGPDVKEEIVLDPDGTQRSHRLSGKSTFGAPIDESYRREGNKVEWRSQADKGQTTVSRAAAYYPISESSPESLAILVRALTRQGSGRLGVVPGGEVGLERLREVRLEADGRSQEVVLFALAGLDFSPSYVWMTKGAQPRLFSFIYPGWMRLVDSTWNAKGEELERLQRKAQDDALEGLASRLAHRRDGTLLIRNARVFDSEKARLLSARDLYVYRGRVAAIYETGSQPHAAAAVIDAGGRVLLPGLYDMHAHESAWGAMLQIAGGVTTVRDLANDNAVLADLQARIETGKSVGPRIIPAGFIEGDSEHAAKHGFVAGSLADVKQAIDWYAQHGYRQIKLYNSFRREWVEETTRYAHQRGLRVSGHVPAFMRAEEVVALGYDEIQHINQIMLNFLVSPKDDTRTLLRFYLVGEKAHALDLDSAPVRRFLSLLKRKGTVVDPTVAIFEMFAQKQGEMNPAYAPVASHFPVVQQRNLRSNAMNITDENIGRFRASYDKMTALVGRMHKAGIPVVAGTDAPARLHPAPRAGAVREGGHPGAGSAADRHLERGPIHRDPRPARVDRAGQAGRSHPGGRRSHHQHQRHPPDQPGDEGRGDLLPFRNLPRARGQAVRQADHHRPGSNEPPQLAAQERSQSPSTWVETIGFCAAVLHCRRGHQRGAAGALAGSKLCPGRGVTRVTPVCWAAARARSIGSVQG